MLLFGAIQLNFEVESTGRSESDKKERTFKEEVKRSCGMIYEAIKIKEIYCLLIWMGLYAILVPNFGSFDYYFMLDVVGIT